MFYQTCRWDWKWFWIKGTPDYQRPPRSSPQDFHFRETFLEVCVTHVSFSCSSSPRFDQVPIEEYWEYWGFATFVFMKTDKKIISYIFDPSKNAKCFEFLFPGSPGVSALRRTPLWGESMDKFTFPLLSLLTRTDTFSPWECHKILSIDFLWQICLWKQTNRHLSSSDFLL